MPKPVDFSTLVSIPTFFDLQKRGFFQFFLTYFIVLLTFSVSCGLDKDRFVRCVYLEDMIEFLGHAAEQILRPEAYSVCELLPIAKRWTVHHQDDTSRDIGFSASLKNYNIPESVLLRKSAECLVFQVSHQSYASGNESSCAFFRLRDYDQDNSVKTCSA